MQLAYSLSASFPRSGSLSCRKMLLAKVAANYESMFRELVKKYNKSHEEALPNVTTLIFCY